MAACGANAGEPARGVVEITTIYPGASPAEVEQNVTVPIERVVAPLRGVRTTRSMSLEGLSVVQIEGTATDPRPLATDVRQAIGSVLEARADPPHVTTVAPTTRELRFLLLHAERYTELEKLSSPIAGMRKISACGEPEPRLEVVVDPARLTAMRVAVDEIIRAIEMTDEPTVSAIGAAAVSHVGEAVVQVKDLAIISTASRACQPMTAPDEGIPVTMLIDSRDRVAVRNQVLEAARERAIELVEVVAPRTLTGTIGVPAGAHHPIRRWFDDIRALPGVTWVIVELNRNATRARLAIGLDRTVEAADFDAAANRAIEAIPELHDLRLAGDGLASAEVALRGPDLDTLRERATTAVNALRRNPAIIAAGCDPCRSTPELVMELDRERAASFGVAPADITFVLRATVGIKVRGGFGLPGRDNQVLRVANDPPVVVRVAATGDDFGGLTVRSVTGNMVPISYVVEFQHRLQEAEIRHENLERTIVVWARGHSLGAVKRALGAVLPAETPRAPSRIRGLSSW